MGARAASGYVGGLTAPPWAKRPDTEPRHDGNREQRRLWKRQAARADAKLGKDKESGR